MSDDTSDESRTSRLDDATLDDATLDDLRSLAAEIAVEAGQHAQRARTSLGAGRRVSHDTKSSSIDPVTVFDRETEELVVARLRASRPDDSIVGEEGANHGGVNDFEWHIDPIDGTVNFVYDQPGWCTSIGLLHRGTPIVGAIFAPPLGDATTALFSAAAGRGAWLGEQRLSVSTADDLATSLVSTGFSYQLADHREQQAAVLARLLPHVRDIRRSGSAALDLAFVAAGRSDGYFEEHLNSWDIAAGVLLVVEAGGVATTYTGDPLDVTDPAGVLVGGPSIHRALHERLRSTVRG